MNERTQHYKVEYPQSGITIYSKQEPSPIDRATSEAFEILGICIVLLPILYVIRVWLQNRDIIRQGFGEADKQSELRRIRREGEG